MSKKISKYFYFFICFSFFVFTTTYVSNLIVDSLKNGYDYANQIFSLSYVENTGAAMNILSDLTELLIIFSVVAICLIISYIMKNCNKLSMKSLFFLSMLAGGIGGNLHERIALRCVRDYIKLEFINFPIFNISDIFITIGVIALIIILLKDKL